MHTLDMIMYPYEKLADRVEFCPDASDSLRIEAEADFDGFDRRRFIDAVAPKLCDAAKRLGVGGRIRIFKGIVLGAGLGGSSAAIAAGIKAMLEYCNDTGRARTLDREYLCRLGSDVPYMCVGGICRVRGVGEDVVPISCKRSLNIDAVIASGGSDTAKCYAIYDRLKEENGLLDAEKSDVPESVEQAVALGRNDLTAVAEMLNPNIKEARIKLERAGYEQVIMSGSGSCVIGINFAD